MQSTSGDDRVAITDLGPRTVFVSFSREEMSQRESGRAALKWSARGIFLDS